MSAGLSQVQSIDLKRAPHPGCTSWGAPGPGHPVCPVRSAPTLLQPIIHPEACMAPHSLSPGLPSSLTAKPQLLPRQQAEPTCSVVTPAASLPTRLLPAHPLGVRWPPGWSSDHPSSPTRESLSAGSAFPPDALTVHFLKPLLKCHLHGVSSRLLYLKPCITLSLASPLFLL